MNANENLKKKIKIAIAIAIAIVLGVVFMSIDIASFLVLNFLSHEFNPHLIGQDPPITLPSILAAIPGPFDSESQIFVSGFLLFLIGLLGFVVFLVGCRKKNESLGEKRKKASVMAVSGVVLTSIGTISLFYVYYAVIIPKIQYNEIPYSPEITLAVFSIGICAGTLSVVSGFLLFLIGLLGFVLIRLGRLKKQ